MQGLANLTSQIGFAIAVLLPAVCYCLATACFVYAGWGFWQQAQPHNPYRGRPWVPALSLLLCGVFSTFDHLLNKADVSAGSDVVVSISGLTTYAAPAVTGNLLGATPSDTLANVVGLFLPFFQPFGAMACVFAAYRWWEIIKGRSNHSSGGCGIQFIFGIACINILTIATWLSNTINPGTTATTGG